MKIILGTRSLLKKNAVQEILDKYSTKIDIENITLELKNVGSNVPETPYNDQAYEGAKNRAYSLRESINEKDTIYVGIESAIAERVEILFEECWTVIVDHNKNVYAGYSSGFMLPNDISIRMKNGESHINVMTEKGNELDISTKDTWSIYSNRFIERKESIKESFRNAFFSYLKSSR